MRLAEEEAEWPLLSVGYPRDHLPEWVGEAVVPESDDAVPPFPLEKSRLVNPLHWGDQKENRNDPAPYRWPYRCCHHVDRLGTLRQSVEPNESPERAGPHEFPPFLPRFLYRRFR